MSVKQGDRVIALWYTAVNHFEFMNNMDGLILFRINRPLWLLTIFFILLAVTVAGFNKATAQEEVTLVEHLVQPGDTWTALAWRYGLDAEELRAANGHINREREPTIGRHLSISNPSLYDRPGIIVVSPAGGLMAASAVQGANPWLIALLNGISSPYRPLLFRPLFMPVGQEPVHELPPGFQTVELSQVPAIPGQAVAVRATREDSSPAELSYAGIPINAFVNGGRLVAIGGTGAFFSPGEHELVINPENGPLWVQPWLMIPGQWTFEEITLTGPAAAIDAESIRLERERLFAIWNLASGTPLWQSSFQSPIQKFLDLSSLYGARRSYNGGPYRSYHEGLDFSAYGGTPVYAPAAGTIVLAETLYVRGGAVIIDHGLGIYTGMYHMSEVTVQTGQNILPGDLVGRVGTTGLSTGNHLHWDLLIAGTWVDPTSWLESDIACWILQGWGQPCLEPAA